ncbi:hypothetical protein RZA67_00410 [Stenotrophomonas sp. C3(2023)]|uniref:hypothetical protein n=1 Tax=Stenotrophomonas sp. C3(2023) TaxID=3080277 RepID=UPI00293C648A|nr:hypothetical protein [Stenotrophomonas sp. C3(2023)]MDV3467198.1 hypothetical protein [Stenotrophomonas sp. C3(2023)]
MSHQMKRCFYATFLCLIIALSIEVLAWRWISAFVRIEAGRLTYVIVFPVLLASSFFVVARKQWKFGLPAVALVGIFSGLVCGTVALTLSNFALSNAMFRLWKSFERDGWLAIFFDLPFAALLGTWLIGGLAFVGSWPLVKAVR